MIDIIELIPNGKKNAISRQLLVAKAGENDRRVRSAISEAKKAHVIASADDGTGYYIPTEEDYDDVLAYRRREWSKAIDILAGLKKVDAWLADVEHNRYEGDF